ncbi:hypothetical protein [Arthrobacter sp. CAN_C5]|uniref:hypothetical protein n=1 Tax=Arthrobacter sp. CAN_C5 TaxID=2760706 RepID=UPI001AE3919F|nr:hypothetical protein [Arthrobacter sp. CAN_C5]MBP2215139.1 hypothetical protein [Arthrobacter sp. CAN_C5]
MSNENSAAPTGKKSKHELEKVSGEPSKEDREDIPPSPKSPVEDSDATPEGLRDAPALEEDDDSLVKPENS